MEKKNYKLDLAFVVENADAIWHNIRWKDGVKCTDCECTDYYSLGDGRYKCKKCGKIFSDTTNTLLHHSKLSKWKWLWAIYKMSNTNGISNIELSKDINVDYHTAYLIQQKVRYLMNQDGITLSGNVCMDEAYIGGWTCMHFNKKMDFMRKNHFIPEDGNTYKKRDILAAVSKKKHHIISMVDEKGKTILLHTPNPITTKIIKQILEKHTTNLETLITDESKLYQNLKGVTVEASNHSKHIFMTTGGHTSNPCENRFSWVKRKINTLYTHTSEKYLQLYLNQMAFSATYKDYSITDRYNILLGTCARNNTHITYQMLQSFNYLDNYDFEDVYAKELEEALYMKEMMGGVCDMIETKHKIKVK